MLWRVKMISPKQGSFLNTNCMERNEIGYATSKSKRGAVTHVFE